MRSERCARSGRRVGLRRLVRLFRSEDGRPPVAVLLSLYLVTVLALVAASVTNSLALRKTRERHGQWIEYLHANQTTLRQSLRETQEELSRMSASLSSEASSEHPNVPKPLRVEPPDSGGGSPEPQSPRSRRCQVQLPISAPEAGLCPPSTEATAFGRRGITRSGNSLLAWPSIQRASSWCGVSEANVCNDTQEMAAFARLFLVAVDCFVRGCLLFSDPHSEISRDIVFPNGSP